jgi:signal transduction histidine kinase
VALGFSHEIRTPLNAVLGVGRLLSDTQLSLEQQQYLSMMTTSSELLLTIINVRMHTCVAAQQAAGLPHSWA